MKTTLTILILVLLSGIGAFAQVGINTDNSVPDPSAMLDVKSSIKGFLPPRVTLTQMSLISNPADGLMVYCTTDSKVYIFIASLGQWKEICVGPGAVSPLVICGTSITINHIAGAVAPVSKTATYGTVINIPGEPAKCWITSNLGADHQASAVNDATEPSAGWYWQFNRKQGRKFDGSTTPTWTIPSISENSDWTASNDPCQSELGGIWRIPSYTEWLNVSNAGGWTNYSGPWNSALKLHYGGWVNTSGTLNNRGSAGVFWTASQSDDSNANDFVFTSSSFAHQTGIKAEGFPVRCLRDTLCQASPPAAPSSGSQVFGSNTITWNWTAIACAQGYKWSATNDFATATDMGGSTSKVETGLTPNTTYTRYAWAYNTYGHSAALTLMATTSVVFQCGDNLAINHQVSNGVAPVNKSTTYSTVNNIPGAPDKCWITKNLGATQQATAASDTTEASAGWYWQFNRKQGYKHDGSAVTPAWTVTSINENTNWLTTNDPCTIELGTPWRLPVYTELYSINSAGGWTNWNGPWGSGLKLHAAGCLSPSGGSLFDRGSSGYYWSSSQESSSWGRTLIFTSGISLVSSDFKAIGFSVRCLR